MITKLIDITFNLIYNGNIFYTYFMFCTYSELLKIINTVLTLDQFYKLLYLYMKF